MSADGPLNLPLLGLRLTAVDFETTGSVPGWPVEPWQIGMVRFALDGSVPMEVFESLIRVGNRPFHTSAPGRHRERRGELFAAPTAMELVPRCLSWWGGGVLVAHNASTERRMIRSLAPLHGGATWLDTLPLARLMFPGLSSYALEDLVPALELEAALDACCPGRAPHDALYDAHACRLLLACMAGQPGLEDWTRRDWLSTR